MLSDRQQEFITNSVPLLSQGILTKAFMGEGSPRQAIKAKCLDCTHFNRAEITDCLVTICPLHAFRPIFGAVELNSASEMPSSLLSDAEGSDGA